MIKEFLPEDPREITIFAHWDADGISSAAILIEFLSEYYKVDKKIFNIIFPEHGRVSIIDYLKTIPKRNLIITLDLGLSDRELSRIENENRKLLLIDHHRIIEKDYTITEKLKSNTLLLEKILKEEGYEPRKELIELGLACDDPEYTPKEISALLKGKVLQKNNIQENKEKFVITEVNTLINSEYRATWKVRVGLNALLNCSFMDIIFSRKKEVELLHKFRKDVAQEILNQKNNCKIIDFEHFLYTEISSRMYIQGLLATVLMIENNYKPVVVTNRTPFGCYLELRARNPKIDYGSIFYNIAEDLNIEAGGHREACGAYFANNIIDKFLVELISKIDKYEEKTESNC